MPLVPLAGRLRSILTPSVTGTAMLLIGLSLMGVPSTGRRADVAQLTTAQPEFAPFGFDGRHNPARHPLWQSFHG
jgi:xanthine/uracil permease